MARRKVTEKKVCDHCGTTWTKYDDGTRQISRAKFDDKYMECRRARSHMWTAVKAVA